MMHMSHLETRWMPKAADPYPSHICTPLNTTEQFYIGPAALGMSRDGGNPGYLGVLFQVGTCLTNSSKHILPSSYPVATYLTHKTTRQFRDLIKGLSTSANTRIPLIHLLQHKPEWSNKFADSLEDSGLLSGVDAGLCPGSSMSWPDCFVKLQGQYSRTRAFVDVVDRSYLIVGFCSGIRQRMLGSGHVHLYSRRRAVFR